MKTDVLEFIKSCVRQRRIRWTYHVNMRLRERLIARYAILSAVDTFEIIEEYPEDRYLPSYLLFAVHENVVFHIHVAVDINEDNVTIVTAYKPALDEWEEDFKTRRRS